jgi:hypothetical protein
MQAKPKHATRDTLATGVLVSCGDRRYETKAISRQGTQLRATLKASSLDADKGFELGTVDLYSHRSRHWFAGLCAKRFGVEQNTIMNDLNTVLENIEAQAHTVGSTETTRLEMTESERAEARELLQSANLMDQITEALTVLGYVGETSNKELAYLVATSRKLSRPLSLLIESRSGAGKSALQDTVLHLMPEEDCLKYSRLTDQALFYKAKDGLEGKLLALEEAAGMGGAAYSIRALQSSEVLKVAATGKDSLTGKMKTEEYEVKARTAVMMTTTRPDFDEETKSRFLCASIDESTAMTQHILQAQRHEDTFEEIAQKHKAEHLERLHQNAQRLLINITVINPYADQLTFPTLSLNARRDNRKYLGLIKTVALLHQMQREVKQGLIEGAEVDYIEVTLNDILITNRIAQKVLVKHQDITPQARQLFGLIRKMLLNGGGHGERSTASFNRRRLREYTGWSDWQVRTHLGELVELEYLQTCQGKSGQEYLYELADTHLLEALPGFAVTDIDELRKALRPNLEGFWPNPEAKNQGLVAP